MTTALQKYDPVLLKKARELAGINTKVSKSSYVKISYNNEGIASGNFLLKLWNSEKESYSDIDLGPTFEAVILTTTKRCSQWDNEIGSNLYESNEFDTYSETISLLSNGEEIEKGTYRELKTKYPDLKLQIVLYLYILDKGFAKMFVKGSTIVDFGNWENYIVNDMGSTIQAFTTIFGNKKKKNGAVTYYALEFKQGEYQDLEKMIKLSQQVRNEIQETRNKFMISPPILETPKEEKEEVKIEDLPF